MRNRCAAQGITASPHFKDLKSNLGNHLFSLHSKDGTYPASLHSIFGTYPGTYPAAG